MNIRMFAVVAAQGLLAGCFTVSESPYPETALSRLPEGKEVAVAVQGFEASLVEYYTAYGTSTAFYPGYFGRCGWYHPGYTATYVTTEQIPQLCPTDAFRQRAQDRLEQAGFIVKAPTSDYLVDVRFTGPVYGSDGWRALWVIGTLFTCDDCEVTWNAQLRIHDNRNGHLLLSQDYAQSYHVRCFSPIPIFGPLSYDRTDGNFTQCWCLNALTDRATADASAFLSAQAK